MWILAKILAEITRHPRQLILPGRDFEWSDNSYTHNIFRFLEMMFGRRYGIKHEMSSIIEDGVTYHVMHSVESCFAFFETYIREGFSSLQFLPFRIFIPVLNIGAPIFGGYPYLFAVGFDSSAKSVETNTATQTFSHTCTGSNLFLVGYGTIENEVVNDYTAFTYNSVSLLANSITSVANSPRFLGAFYIIAPSTGSNTVSATVTGGGFHQEIAASYSGVNQSTPIDQTNTNTSASSTTIAVSVTPNSTNCSGSNCWVACSAINNSTGISTLTPGSLRQNGSAPVSAGDSNGTVTSDSSNTQTFGTGGSNALLWAAITFSFTPTAIAAVTVVNPTLPFLGAG